MGWREDQIGNSRPDGPSLLLTLTLTLLGTALFIAGPGGCSSHDAQHITAILGESVVFNCNVDFPNEQPVPYVLQWEKKVGEDTKLPVYILYDHYPPHIHEQYQGRVSGVAADSNFGAASLNLTDIKTTDQGWYECKVMFFDRYNNTRNGTWFHLDVHAPPRFSVTPEEVIYVNLGDSIILNCQSEGTPQPEILWYKGDKAVETSGTIGIFNAGTELRISHISDNDIGDYTCLARNGEGTISHSTRVIMAGGAVIMVPPTNQTKVEGERVEFQCEAKASPGNVTVRWFRENAPVQEALERRVDIRRDGSLVINPVSSDDSGFYLCEVSNGIGEPQTASAYLNVEYPAKVTFSPTVQFLPFRLAGIVQCYIKANPQMQYVTWIKDKRVLDPYQSKDYVFMNNGSLLITRVNENHQGHYTCTPYNIQGTSGQSGPMEVLVRKPPVFVVEPEKMYQRKVGDSVEMHCEAQEAEGTTKPTIEWHRRDGVPLQKNRVRIIGGNITIENLRKDDFAYYQCVAKNEVATIVTSTQLVIEGTQPHAPYNVVGNATEFSVQLSWLPGYSGGPDYKQDYVIWYRQKGMTDWSIIPVTPSGSTETTISRLQPGTTYQFQVVGKNELGDGMLSQVYEIKTLGQAKEQPTIPPPEPTQPSETTDVDQTKPIAFPTDSSGNIIVPPVFRPTGDKPGQPRNITVTEVHNGFLISWQAPILRNNLVQYYNIKYRTDAQWRTLNKQNIRAEETSYLVKNLVGGRTYHFQIVAHTLTNYQLSEEVKFSVPARVKHKAITAGVVGGILFFIVAIILSVCAVKICNKRKRRKQEKAYNMVACRITDSRNGGQPPGVSQVPSKKNGHRQGRIPGVSKVVAILRRPRLRRRVQDVDEDGRRLERISRAPDGRFVLVDSADDDGSSSDDGGFLSLSNQRLTRAVRHPAQRTRSSWRKPLVGSPSELSMTTEPWRRTGSLSGVPSIYQPQLLVTSSPMDREQNLTASPWSAAADMSSVRMPPSSPPHYQQLRCVHERYSQELPSLRAIHEESERMRTRYPAVSGSVYPLPRQQPVIWRSATSLPPGPRSLSPPRIRIPVTTAWSPEDPPSQPTTASPWAAEDLAAAQYYKRSAHPGYTGYPSGYPGYSPGFPSGYTSVYPTSHRPGGRASRLPARHARHARSAPELSERLLLEASPESRSSSSGFGSKNTSSAHNQSSRSGSTAEWRPPPYRPPPPAPPPHSGTPVTSSSLLSATDWLALTRPRPSPLQSDHGKGCDVSVDGHYEFDAVFVGTPTRDERSLSDSETYPVTIPRVDTNLSRFDDSLSPARSAKYADIDARVQAMKEEFYAFRMRQARRQRSPQLESAC